MTYEIYIFIINQMQSQIKDINDTQTRENPQNDGPSQTQKEAKKKKKFKTKKYIKSPIKHHPFTTNNPLYEALNDQDIFNSNQLNFGPWIKQETKLKPQFFPSVDKKQLTLNFKSQQNPNKFTNDWQNVGMSKSQQLLPKFNSVSSTKLLKFSNKNSNYFRVPVWNAFIEEQAINVSSNYPQISSKKELLQQKQTSLNFETKKRKTNLNFVSIGSTEYLNQGKTIPFDISNRQMNKFSSTKLGRFQEGQTQKMDLLKKMKANAVVYNYCYEKDSLLTSKPLKLRSEEKDWQKKVQKNLKKRKQEIYERKLTEMELKLVVPEQKSKLIFVSNSQKTVKPTVSKYAFMDLLAMRAKAN